MDLGRDNHPLADALRKVRDLAEQGRVLDGIRQGLEDRNAGRTISLEEFKEHVQVKHGISV
jgi:predicted transcriptional regulator